MLLVLKLTIKFLLFIFIQQDMGMEKFLNEEQMLHFHFQYFCFCGPFSLGFRKYLSRIARISLNIYIKYFSYNRADMG